MRGHASMATGVTRSALWRPRGLVAAPALAGLAALALASGAAAQASAHAVRHIEAPSVSSVPGVPADELARIRAATEKYRDVSVALKEGYLRDPSGMCVVSTMEGAPAQLGGMGIHYFRPDVLGITGTSPRVAGTGTHTDFETPGVLIYQPQADGSLRLVAIENLVFEKGWRAAGRQDLPAFHGFQYYHMVDNPLTSADEAHGFEPHYELHFWLYDENPAGAFAPFNPRVSCPAAGTAGSQ